MTDPAYQAIKDLLDAATCIAKGIGFTVTYKIENEIAYAGHRPTLVAGMAESLSVISKISQCTGIPPQEVQRAIGAPPPAAQPGGRIIVAGR